MGRVKKIIPLEKYDKFKNELNLYDNYFHKFINNLTEDDKYNKDKQRMKKIIECIDTLDDDDKYLIITLYLLYNKKVRLLYKDFELQKVINFNSLCNNISKIKIYIKNYVINH